MVGFVDLFRPEGASGVSENALIVPGNFQIRAVDGLTSDAPDVKSDAEKLYAFSADPRKEGVDDALKPVPGELNILEKLKGDFYGLGLNMIFRPSFGINRRNNVLEYNVTEEVTQFIKDLGPVPNRGLGKQQDVEIRAVPYTQMIKDLLNKKTGKADDPNPIPIHFESGLFLRTPPTSFRPVVPQGTISRLASIPHGTTINCQGFEPDMKQPQQGKPEIKPSSVIPFPLTFPDDAETFENFFPQLNVTRKSNLRIPAEIKEGDALNPAIMLNPNLVLNEFNDNSTKKKIKEYWYFKVDSDPKVSGIPGGGTANIGFLAGTGKREGAQNSGPNANGTTVGCEYWVSTVEYDVLLPAGDFSGSAKQERVVESEARKEERAADKKLVSPRFKIELDKNIPPNTMVKFEATQIQYSQNVTLDFDGMSWPHISVASLSPLHPVFIEAAKVVF